MKEKDNKSARVLEISEGKKHKIICLQEYCWFWGTDKSPSIIQINFRHGEFIKQYKSDN